MSLVVITGGARSGKSSAAQLLAESRCREGADVAVAVFGRASDTEMAERIERHRAQRPEEFRTIEVTEPAGWLEGVADDELLLVDCIGTLIGLHLEAMWESCGTALTDAQADGLPEGLAESTEQAVAAVIAAIIDRPGDTIVVTNEVGMGVVPQWASARLFRDLLGRANRELVAAADAAYFYVAGRAVDLTRQGPTISWPED